MCLRFKWLIACLLVAFQGFAQIPIVRSPASITAQDYYVQNLRGLKIPVVADTAHGLNGGLDSLGLVIQIRSTGDWYRRDTSAGTHKWTLFGSGGGGSPNTSVGGKFRVAINGTNNIKSLDTAYGTTLDSSQANIVKIGTDTNSLAPRHIVADTAAVIRALVALKDTGFSVGLYLTKTVSGKFIFVKADSAAMAQYFLRRLDSNQYVSTGRAPDTIRITRHPGTDSVFLCFTPLGGIESCTYQYPDTIGTGGGVDTAVIAQYGLTKSVAGALIGLKLDSATVFPQIRATIPSGGGTTFTRTTITSGTSSTIAGGNYITVFDMTATAATYALTTPASPADKDIIRVEGGSTTIPYGFQVTAFSLVANTGQSISETVIPSFLTSGASMIYEYDLSKTTWRRLQ